MTYTLDIDLKTKEAKSLLEYLKSLNYLKIEETLDEEINVPSWHKKIVLDRLKTSGKTKFSSWSEVKKKLKHK